MSDAYAALLPARVFAFTSHAELPYTDIAYEPGDVLLFGPEPTGLAPEVLADPRITATVRIPMRAGMRSLNLANAAAIAVYEAWRQLGHRAHAESHARHLTRFAVSMASRPAKGRSSRIDPAFRVATRSTLRERPPEHDRHGEWHRR